MIKDPIQNMHTDCAPKTQKASAVPIQSPTIRQSADVVLYSHTNLSSIRFQASAGNIKLNPVSFRAEQYILLHVSAQCCNAHQAVSHYLSPEAS